MKKWIFSLACLFTIALPYNFKQEMVEHSHAVKAKAFLPGDAQHLDGYFVQADYLSVKAMQVTGFDHASQLKLNTALEVLEAVVNSEEFKERVINFKNTLGQRAFASNAGKSNEEVYQQFMQGREVLQPQTPGEMNFYLRLYNNRWSRVVGYTTATSNLININWKFFRNYLPHEVAGNLAHEWVHKLGFDHRSAAEHDSVPYAIGYIVEELAARQLKKQALH